MKKSLLSVVIFSLFCINPFHLQGATKTWAGVSPSCDLATSTNWTGGLPSASDTAVFNKTDTCSGPSLSALALTAFTLQFSGPSGPGYTFGLDNALVDINNGGISSPLPYNVTFILTTSANALFHGGSLSGIVINADSSTVNVLSGVSSAADAAINLTNGGALTTNGSLTLGKLSSAFLSDAISIAGTFSVGSLNATTTVAGAISGTGKLVKVGTGILTISGTNNYSGGTDVDGGELRIASGAALPSSGNITLNGGTLNTASSSLNTASSSLSITNPIVLNTTSTVNVDASAFTTFSGVTSGVGSLTKTGDGTLSLQNTNSYSGGTNILGGVLQVNNLSTSGTITLSGNGTLHTTSIFLSTMPNNINLNTSGTLQVDGGFTLAGQITGGSLTKTGNGFIILSNTGNNYSGGTTIAGGSVIISAASNISTGPITFNTGSLSISNGVTLPNNITIPTFGAVFTLGTVELSGSITGSGSLFAQGAGTIRLSGSNNYSGGTDITGGTLSISAPGNLPSSGSVTFNGASVALDTTTGVAISNPMVLTTSGTVNVNSNTTTLSGLISGSGAFTKSGVGRLILSNGGNSYGGGTNITGGTLSISAAGNLPASEHVTFNGTGVVLDTTIGVAISNPITLTTSGSVNVASNTSTLSGNIGGAGGLTATGAGALILSGTNNYTGGTIVSGTTTLQGNTSSLQGNITNNNSVVFDQTGSGTYAGVMSGAGSLTKQNTGALILSGSNSYGGGTNITGGTLSISATGNLSSSGNVTFNGANTILDTTTGVAISNPVVLTTSGIVNVNSGTTNLSGLISGSGALTKSGAGIMVLSNGTNGYGGGTNITGGTISISIAGNLPAGNVAFNGANVALDTTTGVIVSNPMVLTTSGTVNVNSNTTTLSGLISSSGAFTKSGAGTLVLSNGANSYGGGTNITGGTLSISAAGNLSTIGTQPVTFNGANTVLDTTTGVALSRPIVLSTDGAVSVDSLATTTLSGLISSSGALTKSGEGTLVLSNGANSYGGGTNITGGTLSISAAGNLPSSGSITFNGASMVLDTTTGVAVSNPIVLSMDGAVSVNSLATTTLSGLISGSGALTKSGAGTLVLSNVANSYGGGTIIAGGTLIISAAGNLPSSGTVAFNGASVVLDTTTGVAISNPIALTTSGSVNVGSNTSTLSGNIGGAGGLTATGAGTLILSGINNYAGGTTVSGATTLQGDTSSLQGDIVDDGLLRFSQPTSGAYNGKISGGGSVEKVGNGTVTLTGVNNVGSTVLLAGGGLTVNGTLTSTSTFTAQSGTTLKGTGTITASAISLGGSLQPGDSIGTINVAGPVTFTSTSNYLVEFGSLSCDLINVTGSVTINPGASVTLLQDQPVTSSTSYPIVTATSPIGGTFATLNNPYLFLLATLSYTTPNMVILSIAPNNFFTILTSSNLPSNATAVVSGLNGINPLGGSSLGNILAGLMTATDLNDVVHDLLQMQPSQLKALGVSATNTTVQLHSIIAEHAGSYIKSECTVGNRKKWSVWGDLFGVFSHQAMLHGELGFHDGTGGGLVGVDAAPCKNLSVGGALAYTFTRLDWNHNPSHATVQNGYGILYASWYSSHFFATSAVTGGYNHNDADRNILLFTSPIDTTAHSSFSGGEGSGFVEMGAILHHQKMQFIPFASLHYCYLHHNQFKETGADGLNLKVEDSNANLLRSEAGLQFSSCYKREEYEWIPRLSASVIEENRFKGKHYTAEFVENAGNFFTVKGLRPQHTLFSPKASMQLKKGEDLSFFLGYEGEFGSKFHNNRAHLFMNWSF